MGKIVTLEELKQERERARAEGLRFVFTNGCFDLVHRGHVELLRAARNLGDVLAVAINSDASVTRLKGPRRPIVSQDDRAAVVAALDSVDYVTIFDEDTPERVITVLLPDVLVKGA
ncbi:MAG TPA: D-glycero-beta-D-manno-heptose 1-phosphate adenylyltransferase, partial [Firmicutes bacterium]|nr:D-glycero-beta-D-manno-heptose 1-phosphate adenylyltransferase [Bacillota bacterium]